MRHSWVVLCLIAGAPFAVAQTQGVSGGGSVTLGPTPAIAAQPARVVDYVLLNALMNAQRPSVVIHPDDHLNVTLYGVEAFNTEGRLESNGTLQLPYLGPINLDGLTISEAENKIAATLKSKQLVLEPAVSVVDSEQPSYLITIAGEVARPGTFIAAGEPTLDVLIARGGGLLPTSSPVAQLIRKGLPAPVDIPLASNALQPSYGSLPILPGDVVKVAKVGNYYVVGAIKNQGSYALKNASPTTVEQAIATAGGFGFEALLDSTMIARVEGDKRVLLHVHAGRIMSGQEPDVTLLSDDILFVPTSKLKAAIKGGATGFIVSLASTYIYAHP